jgi:hypothetical protein
VRLSRAGEAGAHGPVRFQIGVAIPVRGSNDLTLISIRWMLQTTWGVADRPVNWPISSKIQSQQQDSEDYA